jgi:hypothetical protein
VVNGGVINILKSSHSPGILDVGVVLLIDAVKGEVFPVDLSTPVRGGIVDDHYLIVGVVLKEDGV